MIQTKWKATRIFLMDALRRFQIGLKTKKRYNLNKWKATRIFLMDALRRFRAYLKTKRWVLSDDSSEFTLEPVLEAAE